jgi:hypothetical protein
MTGPHTAPDGAARTAPMAEMRRLFGVLRANGAAAPLAPQPELGDLDDLLAEASAAGLDVRAKVELPPSGVPPTWALPHNASCRRH